MPDNNNSNKNKGREQFMVVEWTFGHYEFGKPGVTRAELLTKFIQECGQGCSGLIELESIEIKDGNYNCVFHVYGV